MVKSWHYIVFIGIILISISSCGDEPSGGESDSSLTKIPYDPTAFEVDIPDYFPKLENPKDNPLTKEGVELGRFLFYDKLLSVDTSISCASCHLQNGSFTDNLAVSPGVHGVLGDRSAMSLINVGFNYTGLFWDGRSTDLESQALIPVEDPKEMQDTWPNVLDKLRRSERYPTLFRKAFGIENKEEIDRELVAKALAQFQRSIISVDSKFDRFLRGEAVLNDEELWGYSMYIDDTPEITDAQCDHCHSLPFGTSNGYFNNGLQQADNLTDFKDQGRGKVTGIINENGFFRAPTLRNLIYTAPYMHNGSLKTIDEVIDHYASGGHYSPNKDPLIDDITMDDYDKKALKAFLLTLTDEEVLSEEAFKNPFQQ